MTAVADNTAARERYDATREWARANGYEVGPNGWICAEAYHGFLQHERNEAAAARLAEARTELEGRAA
jgi:hypothetical protein